MLREKIESIIGTLTDTQFKELMAMLSDDIKHNRIAFDKLTSLSYIQQLAINSCRLIERW